MTIYQVVGKDYGFIQETYHMMVAYNIAEKFCIKHKEDVYIYLRDEDEHDCNTILFDEYNYVDYCKFLVRIGRGSRINFLENL